MASEVPGAAHPASVGPRGRIDQIDTLRCLAMTVVVAQHCLFFPFGWTGVWLFFVISGFVVTTSLAVRQSERTAQEQLRHFYLRRAARILPIYVIYIAFGAIWSAAAAGHFEWRPFLSLLLFFNNFETTSGQAFYAHFPSGHLWTVSIEMQFYLLFGFAFVFLPRRALLIALGALLALCPLMRMLAGPLLLAQGLDAEKAAFAIYTASFLHFDSFALGALLALRSEVWLKPAMAFRLFLAGLAAVIAYGVSYALVNAALLGQTGVDSLRNVVSGILLGELREGFVYSAIALLAAGIIAVTAAGRAPWAGLAANPLLQAIGRASYGGYVYHLIWVGAGFQLVGAIFAVTGGEAAFSLPQKALVFVIAFPLTASMAHLSFTRLERPIMAWAAGRLKGRTAPLAVA